MPSKRYYIARLPFEHINGKLSPVRVKCPYSDKEEDIYTDGFYYGYRHKYETKSRFAVRTRCRNLNTNPITAAEQTNNALFAQSCAVVAAALRDSRKRQLCRADYSRQSNYPTLRGYAVAQVRANGGNWLSRWE